MRWWRTGPTATPTPCGRSPSRSPAPSTPAASPWPTAAAVVEGLRRGVDGDQGYSGLMTKNPIHTGWDATWLTDRLYSLPELDAHLTEAGDMPPPGWAHTRRANPVGLGRNCDIFETARHWAYRRVRDCPDRTPASASSTYADSSLPRSAPSTPPTPNPCQPARPPRSSPASTAGSPRNRACGPTEPWRTKPH